MTPKELAISMAVRAGKIVQENIDKITATDIENKSPFDYVTEIDKISEQLIISSIKKYFPNHEILAEESGTYKNINTYRWLIDPLDGTTNFIHGNPHCSISIALQKEDKTILGVIYDPFRDELYYAEKGNGAYVSNKRIYVSKQEKLSSCLIATGFPFKCRHLLDQYWLVLSEIFMGISGIRRTGSAALDLAYVACGRFECFFEYDLKPWDIAAGMLLVREAGGRFSDFSGNVSNLDGDETIAANDLVYNELLAVIQRFMKPKTR